MFTKDQKIEDLILEALKHGQLSTFSLIEKISEKRPGTTKQAVYKALRNLKKDETIIQNREEVSLSSVWLKKVSDFVEKAERNYKKSDHPSINFLNLKQGEKIAYSFKTFEATDMFWIHAFDVLADTTPISSHVLIYNPHEWFLLARTESEVFLFDRLIKIKRKLFSLVGNKDPLDIYASKYFDGTTTNYFTLPQLLFKSTYNVNIFDDFLIEVFLDQNITDEIDNVYKANTVFDDSIKMQLVEIIKKKGKNKLVITRNRRKADKMRKIFKKYFVL